METTMYDTLLQLPLFQGLCKDDFTTIIEKVKFHFQHYKKNETIIKQGEACNHLTFLLNGEVASITTDSLQGYTLTETLQGPYIIEPFSLFGMNTNYVATYQSHTDVQILTIEKSFVYAELNNYEIFRLNYLNILSSRIQSAHQKSWNYYIGTLAENFVRFLQTRCHNPEGRKTLYITMEDLARLIHEPRINVSKMLNELHKQELIQLKRKEIVIPAFEKLTESLIQ